MDVCSIMLGRMQRACVWQWPTSVSTIGVQDYNYAPIPLKPLPPMPAEVFLHYFQYEDSASIHWSRRWLQRLPTSFFREYLSKEETVRESMEFRPYVFGWWTMACWLQYALFPFPMFVQISSVRAGGRILPQLVPRIPLHYPPHNIMIGPQWSLIRWQPMHY